MACVRAPRSFSLLLGLCALLATGCSSAARRRPPPLRRRRRRRIAPNRAGWQKLANRIKAPVYCPGWLPDPSDRRDRRQVEQHQLGLARPQLPRELRLAGDRRRARPAASCTSTCAATRAARRSRPAAPAAVESSNVPCFADPHGSRSPRTASRRRCTPSTRTPTSGIRCSSGAPTATSTRSPSTSRRRSPTTTSCVTSSRSCKALVLDRPRRSS